MACKRYEKRLHEFEDFLHDELPEAAREELRSHLAECVVCHGEVQLARECAGLLRSAIEPAAEPEAAFWYRVRAGIHASARAQDFWGSLEFVARRLAWTAALAVLLLAGIEVVRIVAPPSTEAREIFPEPSQPANQEEVLLSLGRNGNNGR